MIPSQDLSTSEWHCLFVCDHFSHSWLPYAGWAQPAQGSQDVTPDSNTSLRRDLRLVLLYKIVNHFAVVTTDDILILADLRTRANHPYKFRTIANTTIFRHSFLWTLSQYGTVYRMRQLKARRLRHSSPAWTLNIAIGISYSLAWYSRWEVCQLLDRSRAVFAPKIQ